jgi:hypothetical protein
MINSDDFERASKNNDALRDELIAAARRTEHLVDASEELFERREQIRERLARIAISAPIAQDLGVVKITVDRRITINFDHAKVALSDTSKLGGRILDALHVAERKLDKFIEKAFSETTASHSSRQISPSTRVTMPRGDR